MNANNNIEAIYPLTPMQQGLFFHTLLQDEGGVYVQQLRCRFAGPLDGEALRGACLEVQRRHAALRSLFPWQGRTEPLQVVLARSEAPFSLQSLEAFETEEAERRLSESLGADRERGFDPAAAPPTRFTLFSLPGRRHELVWSHHHLLLDGWSTGIVLDEIRRCYDAFAAGSAPELAPAAPYADYINWLKGRDRAAAEAYWREQLNALSAPPLLPPSLARRGTAAGVAGGEASLAIDNALYRRLTAFARDHGLTPNTLFSGAWAVLLSRYCGEEEVLFGTILSGRSEEITETERQVGLLINTLPLRVRVEREAEVVEWLGGLQRQLLTMNRHAHTPLAEIQRWSGLPPGTPLFETLFVNENYPLEGGLDRLHGGVTLERVALEERPTHPLNVLLEPLGDGARLRALYDRARFDRDIVERMLGHLLTLAAAMPERRSVGALPLLTEAERRLIVEQWNDTARDYRREARISDLFERRAAERPDASAVVGEGGRLTYGELNRRANRLARHLRARGLRPGDHVGILMNRAPEMVVAVLGVLKAGLAYAPIEPLYPRARVGVILEAVGARCLLTQARHLAAIGELAAPTLERVLCLDREVPGDRAAGAGRKAAGPEALDGYAEDDFANPASAEDPAYVIFTSGSTGIPKGVSVRHRPVINLIEWVNHTFEVTASDRVLFVSSLCFDLSVYDLFGLLAAGGSIHIATERDIEDPERLAALLHEPEVTFWDSAPTLLAAVTPYLDKEARGGGLRLAFVSGDWVPLGLPDALRRHFPTCRFIALGGATEATVWSNYFPVERVDPGWPSIPYGRPIQNAAYYVLDADLNPLPVGVPGDLYIGGECLASGYAGAPELTAERFIADPFRADPRARLYRTGDRARFFADGNIEFLGRVDRQVKLRGFRIELGEVEAVIARHPGVRRVVAVIREDTPGDRRLVAYVLAETGADPDPAALRRLAAEHLPGYMLPSALVAVDDIPRTANGKLDPAALPRPEASAPPPRETRASTASGDPLEELVTGIWSDVLGTPPSAPDADFFDQGGHSILATRMVARLREAVGGELPLRALFESPTVSGLTRRLRELTKPAAGGEITPRPAASGDEQPMSYAQTRLWFLNRLEPDNPFYNVVLAAELEGRLDEEALHRAAREVVRRHQVLRTVYTLRDGEPVQRLLEEMEPPFERHDLRELPGERRKEEALRLARKAGRRPFDLERGPLLRLHLVRTDEQRALATIVLHHIVADGWSMAVLLRELEQLYRAARAHTPSPLPPLAVQYADYAAWQRRWLAGGEMARQLGYWRDTLAGAPVLEPPTDRARPATLGGPGEVIRFDCGGELAGALRALSRREGATLFMTLLAAFDLLLAGWSGQRDIVVGTDIANRTRESTEALIGFFVNQLALRVNLAQDPPFHQLLAQVRRVSLDAYAHQDLPFDQLIQELNPPRALNRMPLFQVKLVLQNVGVGEIDLPDLTLRPLPVDPGTAKYDLLLTLEDDATLGGRLEYSSVLFDRATVERLLERYQGLLRAVCAGPERRASDLWAAVAHDDGEGAKGQRRELRRAGLSKLRKIRRVPGGAEP